MGTCGVHTRVITPGMYPRLCTPSYVPQGMHPRICLSGFLPQGMYPRVWALGYVPQGMGLYIPGYAPDKGLYP